MGGVGIILNLPIVVAVVIGIMRNSLLKVVGNQSFALVYVKKLTNANSKIIVGERKTNNFHGPKFKQAEPLSIDLGQWFPWEELRRSRRKRLSASGVIPR